MASAASKSHLPRCCRPCSLPFAAFSPLVASATRRPPPRVPARLASEAACAGLRGYDAAAPRDVAGEHLDFTRAPGFSPRGFGISVHLDFVTEAEHDALAAELEPHLRSRRFEGGHWDGVISQYREVQRSIRTLSPLARGVCARVAEAFPPGSGAPLSFLHALDLAGEADGGAIAPHVDSVKFSGNVVAGLCLLSPALMRLYHEHSPATVDLLLPRRCLYVMSGEARYHWAHAVVGAGPAAVMSRRRDPNDPAPRPSTPMPEEDGGGGGGAVTFRGQPVVRHRRISLIFRDELEGALPAPPPMKAKASAMQ
jgi:alkylated DNA repair protein alkB family protein 7